MYAFKVSSRPGPSSRGDGNRTRDVTMDQPEGSPNRLMPAAMSGGRMPRSSRATSSTGSRYGSCGWRRTQRGRLRRPPRRVRVLDDGRDSCGRSGRADAAAPGRSDTAAWSAALEESSTFWRASAGCRHGPLEDRAISSRAMTAAPRSSTWCVVTLCLLSNSISRGRWVGKLGVVACARSRVRLSVRTGCGSPPRRRLGAGLLADVPEHEDGRQQQGHGLPGYVRRCRARCRARFEHGHLVPIWRCRPPQAPTSPPQVGEDVAVEVRISRRRTSPVHHQVHARRVDDALSYGCPGTRGHVRRNR